MRVLWLKYIFRIKFKIPILDLMLLPKTVFHLKGYTTVMTSNCILHTVYRRIYCPKFLSVYIYVWDLPEPSLLPYMKCECNWRLKPKFRLSFKILTELSWLGTSVCVYQRHLHIWAATCNFQQFGMCDQQSLGSACAYAQSDQSIC